VSRSQMLAANRRVPRRANGRAIAMRTRTGVGIQAWANRYRVKTRLWPEDGTTVITGRWGHIFEYSDDLLGLLIMPEPPRPRYWGHTRLALSALGMTIRLDGDGEGVATFDPANPEQSRAAIRAAGIKRKRQLSSEQRERRIAFIRSR
jgi:hypothetical protein